MNEFPIGALILPEPARTAAWRAWRYELDVDAMSYECLQTLPAVADCLPRWLEGDRSAARLQGIVKMAWSRNQVRLYRAVQLRQVLLGAGVLPVAITGPLAWSLRAREDGAIRTIPDLTLLIPRQYVFAAVKVLAEQGWALQSPRPDADTLTWSSNLALASGDETLHLHWRLFPMSAIDAIEFEAAMLERLPTIRWREHEFQVLSPEADLLHRLTDRPAWDPVQWQADVLMARFDEVDWVRWRALAEQFGTFFQPVDAVERLMDLRRDWQLPIPAILPLSRRPLQSARRSVIVGGMRFASIRSRCSRLGNLLWKA